MYRLIANSFVFLLPFSVFLIYALNFRDIIQSAWHETGFVTALQAVHFRFHVSLCCLFTFVYLTLLTVKKSAQVQGRFELKTSRFVNSYLKNELGNFAN